MRGAMTSVLFVLKSEDMGRRKYMEDRHKVVDSFTGVYDGHGGEKVADYVKEKLHETLAEKLQQSNSDVKESLRQTFLEVEVKLHDVDMKSGTTATVCVVHPKTQKEEKDQTLTCANVGDSRGVLVSGDGQTQRVTTEHKAGEEAERARIKEAGGVVWFLGTWRVGGELAVSRALGDLNFKERKAGRGCTAEPSIFERT
mmetsp:Transcript_31651/g.78395  ORF Transcript_31651/g.78395 Transcript_31651/m.78395 type:complete len:199 (-) Transcript_31651:317-913(-)